MRRGRFGLLTILLILGTAWAGCMGDVVAARPKARVEAAPTTLNVGDGVSFDARSSSTPEPGALVSYQWDFGDVYYDLAKMYGGICMNYSHMKNEENYSFEMSGDEVNYSFSQGEYLASLEEKFKNWAEENSFDSIIFVPQVSIQVFLLNF